MVAANYSKKNVFFYIYYACIELIQGQSAFFLTACCPYATLLHFWL